MTFPARSKIAAVVLLFFLGTFAGQLRHLLDTVRGKVERGAQITTELRNTTIDRAGDTAALQAQIADLQTKLLAGTATPDQVESLRALVGRLKGVAGPSGSPGPPGPQGVSGPPGQPAAVVPTTATGPPATTTTRLAPTTTSTRPSPSSSTTTTRCAVGLGALLKVGCR